MIYKKITWFLDRKEGYLDFDFYYYDNRCCDQIRYIGCLRIFDTGKIAWEVADLNYLKVMKEIIRSISDVRAIRRFYYESKVENIKRWEAAWDYINSNNLYGNIRCTFFEEDEAKRLRYS
jgi:hypothetical protein